MKLLSLMLSKLRNTKPEVETIELKFSIDAWKYLLCVGEHVVYAYEGVPKEFYFIQLQWEH